MKKLNDLNAREAMNLANYYQSARFENEENYFKQFKNKSRNELVDIVTTSSKLTERWVAATLLALLGDPRINPYQPEMIKVPANCITIGSTLANIEATFDLYKNLGVKKEWLLKEYPKHEIKIATFNIAKYLVTNYEYLVFLKESNHPTLPNSWQFGIYDLTKANHPVYGISAQCAEAYTVWLSKKTNRNFRLPTEYEWEYAAAGEHGNEFPWGPFYSSTFANTLESKIYSSTPVGLFIEGTSPFGCMDMSGNVEEYVSENYFVYPNGSFIHDDLSLGGNYRMTRGGSFTRHADLARCKRRHGFFKKDIYVIGFRLAETL